MPAKKKTPPKSDTPAASSPEGAAGAKKTVKKSAKRTTQTAGPAAKKTTTTRARGTKRTTRKATPVSAPAAQVQGAAVESREITDEMIRERAYFIWHRRGGTPGDPAGDWYAAEQELRREIAAN